MSFDQTLILSERDLRFILYDWLKVDEMTARERFADHDRASFDQVLATAARLAAEQFAPHNRKADENEPTFDGETVSLIPEVGAALAALRDSGLFSASQDYELGGLQLPYVIERAAYAWLQAANMGTTAYAFLTIGAANLLRAHGTPSQIDRYVRPMLEGRFFGTMALSEPQAGSGLADIRTRAVRQEDGSYRLYGNKMWISGGDHELSENIIHLVLARVEGSAPGVKGISLFVAPKYLLDEEGSSAERNDVALAGLNHKMGYRGTTNTLLNFGEGRYLPKGEAGAVAYLVGEEGHGLSAMFHMMNEARVGVGTSAAALGVTGFLHSLEYARTRPQGRRVSNRDLKTPPVPIIEHADVRRMLLAQKAYAEGAMALNLFCASLSDDEATAENPEDRKTAQLLLGILTPIAKSWPSQWCLKANDLAIQVLGGFGYTRDYPVEQFYRDNRLNPIHEGTHGIQAIDLVGRKLPEQGGAAFRLLLGRMEATAKLALADPEHQNNAEALLAAVERLRSVADHLNSQEDRELAIANATLFLEVAGHMVVAWIWLNLALATKGQGDTFSCGKRQAAKYFFEWELPSVDPLCELLEKSNPVTSDMQPSWF